MALGGRGFLDGPGRRLVGRVLKRSLALVPGALELYLREVHPRWIASDRRPFEVSRWVEWGEGLRRKYGLADFRFDREGVWVVDGDGLQWQYDCSASGAVHGVEFGACHETDEWEIVRSLVRPGATVVDVGANIGWYSVRLARLCGCARVLGFEAAPETFERLTANIRRNECGGSVNAFCLALANESGGHVALTRGLGTGNHIVHGASDAGVRLQRVRVETLDGFLAGRDVSELDFVKVDIEGGELNFVRGARETLRCHRPTVMMEVEEGWLARQGDSARELVAEMTGLGFRYDRILGGRRVPGSGRLAEDLRGCRNLLFTPMVGP
jgi:FkbM family methyltransferase